MPSEIELKFALAPGDHEAFRAAPALAGIAPTRHRLLAIYFDTRGHELAARGMALRLRRDGRRWVQTLKAPAKGGGGGLHARSEWEFASAGPALDLSRFAQTPLATLDEPAHLHERLAPVFRVDCMRIAWNVAPAPGTRLEVVLDTGQVSADARAGPISEVEVESIEGDVGAAFDLAARLMEAVPLRPCTVSKAERGYRLRAASRRQPAKAPRVELDKAATPAEAARTVIGTALAQLQANEEGVLDTTDPEFVHQARVALRRIRSALRIFRDAIGAPRADAWRSALGETGRALGAARDWDVFGTEVLPPLLRAFADTKLERSLRTRCARQRGTQREVARKALRSREHASAVLDIARWLALPEPPPLFSESLADFASRLIRKRHKRLVADARHFERLTSEERHRLRIDVKRLRYGVDALASLFPAKRAGRYVEILAALPDALGKANDAITAAQLLPALEPPDSFATFARGWLAAEAQGDRAAFAALLERLASTPRFWGRKPAREQAPADNLVT